MILQDCEMQLLELFSENGSEEVFKLFTKKARCLDDETLSFTFQILP